MNRLKLDFALSSMEERNNFIQKYLGENDDAFSTKPLSSTELETISNYILWGKTSSGKNVKQLKEIQLDSRHKTWAKKEDESLDALIESPTFKESLINSAPIRPLIRKEVFSRSRARKEAPPHILEKLESLWSQIDSIELLINFYEIRTGKRKNPPRPTLLAKFSEAQLEQIKDDSENLSQFLYLKKRHLLVDLRKEQFSLKDTYNPTLVFRPSTHFSETPSVLFDSEVLVLPLGLHNNQALDKKIFNINLAPDLFDTTDLSSVSERLWREPHPTSTTFDFRQLEHVYSVFQQYEMLVDSSLNSNIESTTKLFIRTLLFYVEFSDLTEVQKTILLLKIRKKKNQDIAIFVNKKYGKTYNANYISTIFRQKIIPSINEAAALHYEILGNIFFPENFKTCRKCGRILYINNKLFMKKIKSKDGFSSTCKKCEKTLRENKA